SPSNAAALAMDLEADLGGASVSPTSGLTTKSTGASPSGTFKRPPLPPALDESSPGPPLAADIDLDFDRAPSSVRSRSGQHRAVSISGAASSPGLAAVPLSPSSRSPSSPRLPAVSPLRAEAPAVPLVPL